MRFHDLIHQNYDLLSDTDLEISRFISENKQKIKNLSVKEFAYQSLSSKSSVIRFAQKLGFTGYSEMRNFLKWEMGETVIAEESAFRSQVLQDTKKTIAYIEESDWTEIYQKIDNCRQIYVISTGVTQRSQAAELQRLFLLIDKPLQIIQGDGQSNEFKRITENLKAEDLLFLLSLSGENKNLVEVLNILTLKKAPIISITNLKDNWLSGQADYNLYASSSRSPLPQDWWLQTAATFFLLIEAFAFGYVDYQRQKKLMDK
ncbi:RpiR family glv operon transcriptional regulator [Enterococcus sp. PF1-24]|uniref:MurR/RpiR family transcriptional regulator n=1 Tax=unclassified Enterococcus TaxID=2608891 RepID=UPI0024743A6F|nr:MULTISPECIES: MurR/RpiR family transcriptional regulator [unclassified Enterococcus]MDH6365514.1 RpiR family glv operon transcriptional regulator [Enterococcus sp. PFB1-1]MDH6402615.1 RpiR family glv operon transcriptional regulator [Enterococcus sp. PF1-24]